MREQTPTTPTNKKKKHNSRSNIEARKTTKRLAESIAPAGITSKSHVEEEGEAGRRTNKKATCASGREEGGLEGGDYCVIKVQYSGEGCGVAGGEKAA